jgi:hypothetical protein
MFLGLKLVAFISKCEFKERVSKLRFGISKLECILLERRVEC